MSTITTLTANRTLDNTIINTRYWKVGSASTVSDNADDDLYVGITSDYIHRRSRVVFYPKASDFTNETITSITLTVRVKDLFSSSAKTAQTAIRYSSTNANTDEAYNNALLITNKANFTTTGQKTITITDAAIINNISTWCKKGTPFSLYFGRGVDDGTKKYGIQIYGYTTANPPKLSIEHIPSASTGTISSSPTIGSNFTVNIARSSSSYSHKIIIQSNKDSTKTITSGIITTTSWSYTIQESETYNWIANGASSQSNTRLTIETYSGATKLGSYTTYFTLYAQAKPVVTWSTASIAANSGTSLKNYLVSGYGSLTLSLKAAPVDTGSSISYFRVQINSCNIAIDKKYTASSNSITITNIPKPYVTSTTTLSVNVYAINNRGKESAVKTLQIRCYSYNPPGLSNLNVVRASNSTGTEDLMGTYIYGTASISFTSLKLDNVEQNPASITNITVENKPDAMIVTNSSTSTNLKFNCSNALSEKEYSIKITVTDKITSNTITTIIPSSNFIFHIAKGGKSLGIGSAARANGTINLGWKLLVKKGIAFYNSNGEIAPLSPDLGGTGCNSIESLKTALNINNLSFLPLTGGTLNGSLTINQDLTVKNNLTINGKKIITTDDLNNELYYKTNTIITFTEGIFFGYVTSSTTEIRVVIPLKKRLDNITNINFSNFKCIIRNIDGYAIQANWNEDANYDYINYITDKTINTENQSIVVYLKRDSAWKLRNNGVLSVTASNIKFTLT